MDGDLATLVPSIITAVLECGEVEPDVIPRALADVLGMSLACYSKMAGVEPGELLDKYQELVSKALHESLD